MKIIQEYTKKFSIPLSPDNLGEAYKLMQRYPAKGKTYLIVAPCNYKIAREICQDIKNGVLFPIVEVIVDLSLASPYGGNDKDWCLRNHEEL